MNTVTAVENSRPKEHGGGEQGPPIAGDPESFPSDAELSRTLVAANRVATLSTLTGDGFPYGSVVSYAPDAEGMPIVTECLDKQLQTVMSNSFGFGGTNATLIFAKHN